MAQTRSLPRQLPRFRGDSGAGLGRGRGDGGAVLVEFALVAVALLTIVLGTVDLGRAYFRWTSVKNAAREGAAFAERNPLSQKAAGNCPDPNNIQYRARTEQGAPNTNYAVTVTPAVAGGCQLPSDSQTIWPGQEVTVRVETKMTPISPFVALIAGGDVTIGASQSVVVQG